MTFLLRTLPVAVAILLALSFAFLFSRSLLHMMFEALGRMVASHQADAGSE